MCLESCNNFLLQNKTSVNVELPSNLYEILHSKEADDSKAESFVLNATMTGSVTQNQSKTITKSSEPLSIVFNDVPLNSIITVEITISSNGIVLYSGKSAETTITNTDTTIDLTLSAKSEQVKPQDPDQPVTYTITYDLNGGISGFVLENQTTTQGKSIILATSDGITKTNSTFAGWNTQADGKGTTYEAGSNCTIGESVTLYAKWNYATNLSKIRIGDIDYNKTEEIVVIENPTTIIGSDSNWSTYCNTGDSYVYKGVFVNDVNTKLTSFVMGKYEVTQELYEAVMKENPSGFQGEANSPYGDETQKLRPVENVTWYEAVVFCNELTKLTMGESECVYYEEGAFMNIYVDSTHPYVFVNPDKKGYRLPTEAEWEFAARGGDTTVEVWKYAYAGAQADSVESFKSVENNLDLKCWYYQNSISKTHEVGLKTSNSLGLFDMSGNVCEWCYDSVGSYRVLRGGSWKSNLPCYCSVSYRILDVTPSSKGPDYGFRICRSL